MIDVWSYWRWSTKPGREYGEARIVGTRNPAWPKLSSSTADASRSGSTGGATWSKNPPHSS